MRPVFVQMEEGRRAVRWLRLFVFSVTVLTLCTVGAEALWWGLTGLAGPGALVVGFVIGTVLVVRVVAQTLTYQEAEIETTVGAS